MNAPIALFAYNRKEKLERTLSALEKNHLAAASDLIIFSDAAKGSADEETVNAVSAVRAFLAEYLKKNEAVPTFRSVKLRLRECNYGLAKSIIEGVTEVIHQYGKIIVVEDDLICHPNFLTYMNEGLDYYQDKGNYGSISGYTEDFHELKSYPHDVYATLKGECWGWATWRNRWDETDWSLNDYDEYIHSRKRRREFEALQSGFDEMLIQRRHNQINSWAVIWCYSLCKRNLLTVYPRSSLTFNIGYDGSGTNFNHYEKERVEAVENRIKSMNPDLFAKPRFEVVGRNRKFERRAAADSAKFYQLARGKMKFEMRVLRREE